MSLLLRSSARDWNPFRSLLRAMRDDRASYPLGYVAAFDGSRGWIILGVMLMHTRPALFPGATLYMDIFFTFSGYLITALLLKDYIRHGHIKLGAFYLRRLMRLYPALIALIATLAVAWSVFSNDLSARLREGVVSLFYLTDMPWLEGVDFAYTGHTWSLAVEEQFYLLWPLALIALLRLGGVTTRTALTIFALAAAFWGWRIAMVTNGVGLRHLYSGPESHADALLIGCGLAVLLKAIDLADYPRAWRLCAAALLPITFGFFLFGFAAWGLTRWFYGVSPLFGAIPAAIAIVGLQYPQRMAIHRLYDHAVPVFCGRLCYGLYLWHFPILMWISEWARPRYLIAFLLGWPLTFAAAMLSYYAIERPFMRARPGLG